MPLQQVGDGETETITIYAVGPYDWKNLVRETKLRPASLQLIALTLKDYAGPDGSNVFPSIETLSDDLGISRSTVLAGLQALNRSGLICTLKRGHSHGRGNTDQGVATRRRLTAPEHLLIDTGRLTNDGTVVVGKGAFTPKGAKYVQPLGHIYLDESGKHVRFVGLDNAETCPDFQETSPNFQETSPDFQETSPTGRTLSFQYLTSNTEENQSDHPISGDVTLRDAHERDALTDSIPDDPEEYTNASAFLHKLPDLGQSHLGQVPDEMPIRDRVITAAKLAGWNAERKAS